MVTIDLMDGLTTRCHSIRMSSSVALWFCSTVVMASEQSDDDGLDRGVTLCAVLSILSSITQHARNTIMKPLQPEQSLCLPACL
jgi:hypothetical protein